ncbi:hypothetical protein FQN60_006209 [Etheostoma spectabile]|uniref:Uncharacterized protein n=1 Tax=Etheostoma spectabile TaxID=54343 RepID=A0A5J5CKR5_9PERO|nr:hypothetical protein FQN60_006209 [Etheostoma spectabile]
MSSIQQPRCTLTPPLRLSDGPSEYTLRKRLPGNSQRDERCLRQHEDDFRAQLARCQKLLEGGVTGRSAFTAWACPSTGPSTLPFSCRPAARGLQLAPTPPRWSSWTTWNLKIPMSRGPMTRTRNNSAIHIKVFYPDPHGIGNGSAANSQTSKFPGDKSSQ